MQRILWGYDESTQQISPLPASPWLLPSIGILLTLTLWESIRSVFRKKTIPRPPNFNQEEYDHNRRRYYYLVEKQFNGEELTFSEHCELNERLPRPSWARPGEWWTY